MDKKLLDKIIEESFQYYKKGHVATYIPALGRVNPEQLGIAVYDLENNEQYFAGNAETSFAIESISKVPVLLLAIEERGLKNVFNKVDAEPTGFSFNSILNMEINKRTYPMNPFVNTGAIVINSLINGKNSDERFEKILSFMKLICNNEHLTLNQEIYESESRTGDINRSLAYYMKANDMFDGDVEDVLDSYFKQCSVNVNTIDLSNLAAVLANNGIAPWNNQQIVSEEAAITVKSIMTTAGLYDESGDFSTHVGIPAKSGVGGGLMAVSPDKFGIGVFGPALDKEGNSTAGMKALKLLVEKVGLNIFE
ncbi:glutaminase A [Ligilactobacillus cholophilus]|uniref:glutaminase A n=1 Tax=Ligilactobacillus cholophilus TaxID=3050131 RepID=UPI0025B005DC|nr:glutaminase A [Ligilactobacillus cholophilus]